MTFKKGQSGNPSGRKPGIPDRRTHLRNAIQQNIAPVIAKLQEQALEGDTAAAALLLSRGIAPLRAESEDRVSFAFNPKATPAENIEAVLRAVAAGEMSVDTGAQLITGIEKLANVRVSEQTEDRELALINAFRDMAKKVPV